MDPSDWATEVETRTREDAIRQARRMADLMNVGTTAERECRDCGCEIPEARRQAIPNVKRCVGCQSKRERPGP